MNLKTSQEPTKTKNEPNIYMDDKTDHFVLRLHMNLQNNLIKRTLKLLIYQQSFLERFCSVYICI